MCFFSWNCQSCNHPMLSPHATNKVNDWMTQVVVQFEDGTRMIGEYDGYGRVNGVSFNYDDSPECYHFSCWEASGTPAYDCESISSRDQGYFFDEGEHNMAEPIVRKTI